MFSLTLEVDPSLIRPPYYHVHHAEVLRFLERGRLAFLESIGFPTEQFMAQDIFLVLTAIGIEYKREVKGGTISVTCEDGAIDGRTIWIGQRILNERGKVCVEAKVASMCMQGSTRRGVEPPQPFAAALLEGLGKPGA